jgi:putative PEP-CTERM system integral membrane protein
MNAATPVLEPTRKPAGILRGAGYGLFWSWNTIFLVFLVFGFAPQMLPDLMRAVRDGTVQVEYLVYATILTLIPVGVMILGATRLRRSPDRLLALGYGFEGPVMLVLVIRFFVVRDPTPGVDLVLWVAGLGLATFLWYLLDREADVRWPLVGPLRLVGLTLVLITGVYAGVWVAFYVVPLLTQLGQILQGMWEMLTHPAWEQLVFWFLGTVLFLYTATLFAGLPVAVPVIYGLAWRSTARALDGRFGRLRAVALAGAVVVVCGGLALWANRQPQREAFALLEAKPASLAQAQKLLGQQTRLRQGLLNAYLAPVRYLSAVGEADHIRRLYESAFHLNADSAKRVQDLYEVIARPVLYDPVHSPAAAAPASQSAVQAESAEAAQLYESYFDQPIVDGEHAAIVRAVRSTWSAEQALAGWQAVDDRQVRVARQEISVTEQGDWAEVELYEVYENQTNQRQEVVYYFNLPESAVVTGLWLGNSRDRAARFAYQVAPRGAAQQIYKNEVRYNRDPALIEQLGPRQYRLRIFPVEPQTWVWTQGNAGATKKAGPPLHMWLTYAVLADHNTWPLPQLADKRNVYWDATSVRLLNGRPQAADATHWLVPAVTARAASVPAAHRVDFRNGQTVVVQPAAGAEPVVPGAQTRWAVVLDRSGSMSGQAEAVRAALAWLAQVPGAETDLYLTTTAYRGEAPTKVSLANFEASRVMYTGGQNSAELLAQFAQLQAGQTYTAILVLTDKGSFKLGGTEVAVPVPSAPVWLVHLGHEFPLGYDDATLQAIQGSGGGVAGSVQEAVQRLSAGRAGPGLASAAVLDGYQWSVRPTAKAGTSATDPAFAALAARQLILNTMGPLRGARASPETLDQLQTLAKENSIVTPYSSMIVLVTERQAAQLAALEQGADRFAREAEAVGETPAQNGLQVTGVPEPEEWVLLALAAALLLGWTIRTRRLANIR